MALRSPDSIQIPDGSTTIPRLRWDTQLVNKLCRAIDANDGVWPDKFGDVVVDQDDLIIAGVHRTSAARKRGIEEIPVTVRNFKDLEERLLFAYSDNAEHGKPWSAKEEAMLLILAEQHGINRVKIASALRMPAISADRKPIVNVVRRGTDGTNAVVSRAYVPRPLRQTMKHRSEVSEAEAATMESFQTPVSAGVHLAEIVRIGQMDSFPTLNSDLHVLIQEATAYLNQWVARDQHLL